MKKRRKAIVFILAVLLITSISGVAFAAPYEWTGFPEMRLNDEDWAGAGNYVKGLQTVSKYHMAIGTSYAVDGVFGTITQTNIIAYQTEHGLSGIGKDDLGCVGYYTWEQMNNHLHSVSTPALQTGYFQIKKNSGHTNTTFFERRASDLDWRIYKAAPGTAPGLWYRLEY